MFHSELVCTFTPRQSRQSFILLIASIFSFVGCTMKGFGKSISKQMKNRKSPTEITPDVFLVSHHVNKYLHTTEKENN